QPLLPLRPRVFRRWHTAVADHGFGQFDRGLLRGGLPADAGFMPEALHFRVLDAPRLALLGPLDRAPQLAVDDEQAMLVVRPLDRDGFLSAGIVVHGRPHRTM